MIEYIELKNFQCHRHLKLELDKLVTTILGPSDRGKTAIFRAIRWLAFNRPGGNRFIRNGAKRCSVSLATKTTIYTRKKGPGINRYTVTDRKTNNKSIMEAFGSDVPIAKLLGIFEGNFQNQFDGPFWFTLSPGQVAKELNKIVDLSLLDRIQSTAAKKLRNARTEVEVMRAQYRKAKEDVRKTQWLNLARKKWDAIIYRRKKMEQVNTAIEETGHMIDLFHDERSSRKDFTKIDAMFTTFREHREERNAYAESVRVLDGLINDYQEQYQLCQHAKENLREAKERMDKARRLANRCPTCGQVIKGSSEQQ